jgi:hypothetical protein
LLLGDGTGVAVADKNNHRLCVFSFSGKYAAAVGSKEQGLFHPHDVLECTADRSFIVANYDSDALVKLSRDGVDDGVNGNRSSGDGKIIGQTALAALPNGGCYVMASKCGQLKQCVHQQVRLAWMRACACRTRCNIEHQHGFPSLCGTGLANVHAPPQHFVRAAICTVM